MGNSGNISCIHGAQLLCLNNGKASCNITVFNASARPSLGAYWLMWFWPLEEDKKLGHISYSDCSRSLESGNSITLRWIPPQWPKRPLLTDTESSRLHDSESKNQCCQKETSHMIRTTFWFVDLGWKLFFFFGIQVTGLLNPMGKNNGTHYMECSTLPHLESELHTY